MQLPLAVCVRPDWVRHSESPWYLYQPLRREAVKLEPLVGIILVERLILPYQEGEKCVGRSVCINGGGV